MNSFRLRIRSPRSRPGGVPSVFFILLCAMPLPICGGFPCPNPLVSGSPGFVLPLRYSPANVRFSEHGTSLGRALAELSSRAPRLTYPQAIDALMQASPAARASVGIQVVDLKTGNALYSRNADRLFLPASNMKLFTAALALERLGPDYRMTTRLVRAPSGDLILVGGGDPSLSGRAYPYQKDTPTPKPNPLQAIEEFADQAVAAGIMRVDGDIVGDDQLYPWAPYPPSWTVDDMTQRGRRSRERAHGERQRHHPLDSSRGAGGRAGGDLASNPRSSISPSTIACSPWPARRKPASG